MIQLLFIALIINNAISAMDLRKSKNTQNKNELLETLDKIKASLAKDSKNIPLIPENLITNLPDNHKSRTKRINDRIIYTNQEKGAGVLIQKEVIKQNQLKPKIIMLPYVDENFTKQTIAIIDEVREYLNLQTNPPVIFPTASVKKITDTTQPSMVTPFFGSGKIYTHFHTTTGVVA